MKNHRSIKYNSTKFKLPKPTFELLEESKELRFKRDKYSPLTDSHIHILNQLKEAWENGYPEISEKTLTKNLRDSLPVSHNRLKDVFKTLKGWNKIIKRVRKGVYCLNLKQHYNLNEPSNKPLLKKDHDKIKTIIKTSTKFTPITRLQKFMVFLDDSIYVLKLLMNPPIETWEEFSKRNTQIPKREKKGERFFRGIIIENPEYTERQRKNQLELAREQPAAGKNMHFGALVKWHKMTADGIAAALGKDDQLYFERLCPIDPYDYCKDDFYPHLPPPNLKYWINILIWFKKNKNDADLREIFHPADLPPIKKLNVLA